MDTFKNRTIPLICGAAMSINFIIFWAIPIMGMGSLYKSCLKKILQPMYLHLEGNDTFRSFASKYIYSKPEHADYFAMSVLTIISCLISIPTMFYWQLKYGYLPLWLIGAYYCSWVGLGGSIMGTAYSLAHKEGHYYGLYKKWLREYVGHFFENWLGVFFGNVPFNFTTSHVYIHHRLDGGIGDTFYMWDINRNNLNDFMLYVYRIFLHMIGQSSLRFFRFNNLMSKADQLEWGIRTYIMTIAVILSITRSPSFVFWMIIEPLLCMSYFLALLNVGYHGFLEFDEHGNHIPTVNATAIIDGEDDLFGEDDHMTHHYNTNVYFKDLPAHQKSKIDEFRRTKASVFKTLSIIELSVCVLLGQWDHLADYYVDYSEKMTKAEIAAMLKERAQRTEVTYDEYQSYLKNPTEEARKILAQRQQHYHNSSNQKVQQNK